VIQKLGQMFVDKGLISAAQLEAALRFQKKRGGKLGDVLIHLSFVDDAHMAEVLAEHHGLALLSAGDLNPKEELMSLLPREIIEEEELIPTKKSGNLLTLAMSDPTALDIVEEIRFRTGMEIETSIVSHSDCRRAINRYYYGVMGPKVSTRTAAVKPRPAAVPAPAPAPASATSPAPAPTPAPVAGAAPPAGDVPGPVAALTALIDLLNDKGVVTREELLRRVPGLKGQAAQPDQEKAPGVD